jgi:hypothetical protein
LHDKNLTDLSQVAVSYNVSCFDKGMKKEIIEYFNKAVQEGNLDLLKDLFSEEGCIGDNSTFDIDVMKWLREIGCPWDEVTFWRAAQQGNLENMKWLEENYIFVCS